MGVLSTRCGKKCHELILSFFDAHSHSRWGGAGRGGDRRGRPSPPLVGRRAAPPGVRRQVGMYDGTQTAETTVQTQHAQAPCHKIWSRSPAPSIF